VNRISTIFAAGQRESSARRAGVALGCALACGALLAAASPALAGKAKTTRVSVSSSGRQGNNESGAPSISANGRFVAFASDASNLVPGDTNDGIDVFVRDLRTGETRRVSVSSSGAQGNHRSGAPSISADGRFVAFWSYASNLVDGDTNRSRDVFVHDLRTGETRRVSVSSSGAQANGSSFNPSISADGRFVAFVSPASNLVDGDTNGAYDVFVHDLRTGETRRVSVSSSGAQANKLFSLNPSISTDGRFVAFESQASNLVPGDTNRANDVFVHDLRTDKTRRVSVSSSGAQANGSGFFPLSAYPSISADGRFVAFDSPAPNLVRRDTNRRPDVFIHDLRTGETRLVSVSSRGRQGNKKSFNPSISAAGHFVAFKSYATDLVRHDTNASRDVFVHGLRTGKARRVSVSSRGRQGNKDSGTPSISADGRFVAFASDAPNLVPGDTNRAFDVFRRGPLRWR
jgi:Tol biopolymer transport system component